MANQNNEPRKVTRQNWKPNRLFNVASGLWGTVYSVFKVILGALATVGIIAGICLLVFVWTLGDYLQEDILPNSEVTLEGFDLSQNSNTYYLDSDGNLQVLQKLLIECLLPCPINGFLDHMNPLRPLDITELALNTGSIAIDPIPAFT